MLVVDPPATAGGTDRVQAYHLLLTSLLRLNIEVAIDLEGFDLFRVFKGLLYFAWRDPRFLAVDRHAKGHGEAFDDSFVVE